MAPQSSSIAGPHKSDGPLTLWEAMGQLHEIQTQEQIALEKGDIELFQELLEQQARAWQVVYTQAGELIARGKAPPDMISRLEKILNIHHDRTRQLQEAKAQIEARLESLGNSERAA